ncbi:hypothetical protein DWW99_07745 [[Clostridium] leptum]|nr:hypothetical protein DWW99_07745 [[Clostridium] leptum]
MQLRPPPADSGAARLLFLFSQVSPRFEPLSAGASIYLCRWYYYTTWLSWLQSAAVPMRFILSLTLFSGNLCFSTLFVESH